MSSRLDWLRDRLGMAPGEETEAPEPPQVDAAMRVAIARAAQAPAGRRASDALLAAVVDESIRRPRGSRSALARAQYAALVGSWFAEVGALMPISHGALHDSFDGARMPVLKLTLTDRRIFADRQHTVRKLMEAAVDAATPAALGQPGSRELIEAQVQTPLNRIADLADGVQPMLEHIPQIAPDIAGRFLDEARDATATRREALQRRARAVAAQELETQILGRELPTEAVLFLRQGWVPMMATLLLRDGIGSATSENGMTLLTRLLAIVDGRHPLTADPQLVPAARQALLDAGQPRASAERLLNALQSSLIKLPPPRPRRS